jgi:hypothetical protein
LKNANGYGDLKIVCRFGVAKQIFRHLRVESLRQCVYALGEQKVRKFQFFGQLLGFCFKNFGSGGIIDVRCLNGGEMQRADKFSVDSDEVPA